MNALQQVSSPILLTPAYGRRYATVAEMAKDWEDGKDFSIGLWGCGPYASIRDIHALRADASSVSIVDLRSRIRIFL